MKGRPVNRWDRIGAGIVTAAWILGCALCLVMAFSTV